MSPQGQLGGAGAGDVHRASAEAAGPLVVAEPYADNLEFLADLEAEVVAWVTAYESRQQEGTREESGERARLLGMAERRRQRLVATQAPIPWKTVVDVHRLSDFEQRVLAFLFVLRESPHVADRIGRGSGRRYRVAAWETDEWCTPARILSVFCDGARDALKCRGVFGLDRPLFAKGLLAPIQISRSCSLVTEELRLSAETSAWILDDDATLSHVAAGIEVDWPTETFDQIILDPEVEALLSNIVEHYDDYEKLRRNLGIDAAVTYGRGTVLLFHGPPGTGKTLAARAMAGANRRPLITLDINAAVDRRSLGAEEVLQLGLTESYRRHGILLVDECEELLAPEGLAAYTGPFLKLLEQAEGMVILTTNHPICLSRALERRILHRLRFDTPTLGQRVAIWQLLLPEPLHLPIEELETLSRRFPLTGGYIKNVVLQAVQELAMRGGGSLEPEERSALVLRAAQHQAERLHDTMIESSGVLRRRVSRRGWIPAMQADEVGEVVELARAHLECGELGDADRVLPTPGFRALLHAEELSVTLETTDAIARSLDLEVIEVSLSDLLDAEGEKMNADGAGFSVEAFLGGARQQYLVLVNLGEQTGPQPDESLTGRLSKIAHVTDGLLVAVMETRHPPSRQWARYFQRQIRLSSKDPGGCGYIRQLAADAGWKWEVTETALSPERFRRSRDVLRDVFREATFRAVLSGHAGVMTRESLEGGLERVGRRDALAGAVLFGRR